MQFVNNEPEQIEIRRSQNTLIVVGSGIILFSIWSCVKLLSLLFILRKETVEAFRYRIDETGALSDKAIFWILIITLLIFTVLLMSVRIFVGMSAISEGRGKRPGIVYLLIAFIMIIGGIWSFAANLVSASAPEQLGAFTRDQSLSALIIDLTSVIMLVQMVASAFRVRKLRKKG